MATETELKRYSDFEMGLLESFRQERERGIRLDKNAVRNVFNAAYSILELILSGNKKFSIATLRTYAEEVSRAAKRNPPFAEEIIKMSDTDAIAEFDAVILEMRQNAASIEAEGKDAITRYYERVKHLIEAV